MVRHSQLAPVTVTVTDGAKHCVTARQWSDEIQVYFFIYVYLKGPLGMRHFQCCQF